MRERNDYVGDGELYEDLPRNGAQVLEGCIGEDGEARAGDGEKRGDHDSCRESCHEAMVVYGQRGIVGRIAVHCRRSGSIVCCI